MEKKSFTDLIKKEALLLGFDGCGISKAEILSPHDVFLQNWLDKGFHATMNYMENHFEKRVNPSKLMPGAKSVISIFMNYFPKETQKDNKSPVIAKYAYGADYHKVIKKKLNQLLEYIQTNLTHCQGRVFTDSAPLLEKALAERSGLGWIGKNTLLIAPKSGSFIFLGEIIIDIELEYDLPIKNRCGSCTKCIDSCPTNALIAPFILDSNRCISFQTIENKGIIPSSLKGKFCNRIFGCDICQDVCPWNNTLKPTGEPAFVPDQNFLKLTPEEWKTMDEKTFNTLFKHSALNRSKFNGLRRNIDFIQ